MIMLATIINVTKINDKIIKGGNATEINAPN